ncbi:hypothetical protein EDD85DRAFT_1000515 [Armillaria nabsnona]|nr:hypothetical protein EDD85DRAFT_1000515 [Armillaria nabsnona]
MSPLTLIPIGDIPASLDIGATIGAVYIGATIAAVFYGITVLQTVIYYKQNPNDPWLFRYAVALLWILDTLHVALSTHALYFYLIESFGKYLSLFTIIWSFPLQLVINMLIVFGVQLLVSFLVFSVIIGDSVPGTTDYTPLESGNSAAIFIRSFHGTGIYVIYDTYTLSSFLGISTIRVGSRLLSRTSVSIYTVFSTIAGADFIIAGAMCFYLHKGRSMTSFSRTHATCGDIWLGHKYIAWPHTLVFIAADFILPKPHAKSSPTVYINSLLAMLNSRKSPTWSGPKERPADQKMLRFAPHDSSNRVINSGGTNFTVPLSVTEGIGAALLSPGSPAAIWKRSIPRLAHLRHSNFSSRFSCPRLFLKTKVTFMNTGVPEGRSMLALAFPLLSGPGSPTSAEADHAVLAREQHPFVNQKNLEEVRNESPGHRLGEAKEISVT